MPPPRVPLALVAAVARNRVIGRDDALPWRLAGDMRHFRAVTMGKPVLMGRRTWASIGRPLPGRHVVVLSRDPSFRPDGADTAPDLETALDRAATIARERGASEIMVAGGGTLYTALIGRAQTLHLTEVDLAPPGDTLFPPVDPALWVEAARTAHPRGERDDAAFTTVTYVRRERNPQSS